MALFTIISDFITQYVPDFATYTVEYLLLAVLVVLIIRRIRK